MNDVVTYFLAEWRHMTSSLCDLTPHVFTWSQTHVTWLTLWRPLLFMRRTSVCFYFLQLFRQDERLTSDKGATFFFFFFASNL